MVNVMDVRTHIDNNGRLLIPVELRKKYNLNNGSAVVIRIIDNEIKIVNISQMITEAQDLIRKYIPEGTDLVAELRSMRDQEALLEDSAVSSFNSSRKEKEGYR
jgi:AbrB family looped-hinge helix DNA binding protein